jgi:ParB family chromosome partitioning protein
MQIIEKKVTELKAYEKNPRKNDNAVEPVAESIKEFGFKVPIIVDKEYSEIVEIAREYISAIGGFEKFAEWGLY